MHIRAFVDEINYKFKLNLTRDYKDEAGHTVLPEHPAEEFAYHHLHFCLRCKHGMWLEDNRRTHALPKQDHVFAISPMKYQNFAQR